MSKAKIVLSAWCALGVVSGVGHAAPGTSVAPSVGRVTPNPVNVNPNVGVVNHNSVNIASNGRNYGYRYTYTILTPNGYITRTYILPYPPSYYYRSPVPQYYGNANNRRYRRSRR